MTSAAEPALVAAPMPLAMAGSGETVQVTAIDGGAGLQRRLAEIGLGPGAVFRVETRGRPGPFLICLKGARMILGHGMVRHIRVRPVPRAAASCGP